MKKILFILAIALSANSFAQKTDKAYSKGSSSVSLAHGIGNIWKTLFKKTTNFGNPTITSLGPYSLVYEYGFTPRISGGIAFGYTIIKAHVYYASSYSTDEKLTNFSALARGNYHFGRSARIDPYIGGGLGYYQFRYTSVDNTGSSAPGRITVPGSFGLNGQLGAKYYFSQHFAALVEVGYVVGSYVQVGLTARF